MSYEILDDYILSFTYHAKDEKKVIQVIWIFSATYHLEGTTLTISYHATSDKDTLINITKSFIFQLKDINIISIITLLKIDADYYEHLDADVLLQVKRKL